MALELPRRKFLLGLTGLFCAPAIIKVAPLMRIKAVPRHAIVTGWDAYGERVTETIDFGNIRSMLLQGLQEIDREWGKMPAQWDRIFA